MDRMPVPSAGTTPTADELTALLRALRAWAGNPSYAELARRIGAARQARGGPATGAAPGRVTVYDCFRSGRRRLDMDLVLDIVAALGAEGAALDQWRRAVRALLARPEAGAVRVHTRLPVPVEPFTGRRAELAAAVSAVTAATADTAASDTAEAADTAVTAGAAATAVTAVAGAGPAAASDRHVLAVTGMPGAGKTQFALRAAHALAEAGRGTRGRLFVDLHGYHGALPPADPNAVLAGLLVALGHPADRVHRMDPAARAARWQEVLAERDVLVVLDNAVGEDQLRPLLPAPATDDDRPRRPTSPPPATTAGGGTVLVTSRRHLPGLSRLATRPRPTTPGRPATGADLGAPGRPAVSDDSAAAGRPAVLSDLAAPADPGRPATGAEPAAPDRPAAPAGPADPAGPAQPAHRAEPTGSVTVHMVGLRPLSAAESAELFARVVGEDRVRGEPRAVAELGRLCGHLPLDLAVNAAHIARTPGWSLADQARRLAALPRGAATRPALTASYRQLGPEDRRLFRLLALHPGGGISAAAAGALAGRPVQAAGTSLRLLGHEHLLQPAAAARYEHRAAADRYEFHDLVRAFARDLLVDEVPHSAQAEALDRLFDHYRDTAAAAAAAVSGHLPGGLRPPEPELFDDADHAVAWLDQEWTAAVAAAVHAAELGRGEHTCALSHLLDRYLIDAGHWDAAEDLHRHALDAGGPADRVLTLRHLGGVHERRAQYEDALRLHRAALDLARTIGDDAGMSGALNQIGNVHKQTGRFTEALAHYREAAALAERCGDRPGLTRVLYNLSDTCRILGRTDEAVRANEAAVRLTGETGDLTMEATLRCGLGVLHTRAGRYADALAQLAEAVAAARRTHDFRTELYALACTGDVHIRQGDPAAALADNELALRIALELGSRYWEAACRANLAEVHLALGDPARAADCARAALDMATAIGDRNIEVLALTALGGAAARAGDFAAAGRRFEAAVAAAELLGDPYELARAHEWFGDALGAAGAAEEAAGHWGRAATGYRAAGASDAARAATKAAAR